MNEKTMTITRMEAPAQLPVRKRVAAYARVSMEKDAMLHSLAAQVSYYSERIQQNPEWEYAGVFADFGLTGTKETRPEFQRMLKECREGKIDLILVKSISRFARNTLALLNTVRELKGLGIGVYFEEQKLDTLSGDGEIMLTILAPFAQEESRSVSENCKWRIRKKFEQGIPTGFGMYGYEVRNGSFAIKPEEAAVVRRIFRMYLDGMGSVKIMKRLTEEGVPAPLGGLWNASVVMEMLKNEKYAGVLLLQKFYTNNMWRRNGFTIAESCRSILWARIMNQSLTEKPSTRCSRKSPGERRGVKRPRRKGMLRNRRLLLLRTKNARIKTLAENQSL